MNAPRHLFLTGFRGTGKTTVALILGEQLGLSTIDLDEAIEERSGETIRSIFDRGGESLFRNLESDALRDVVLGPSSIISLGGGAILRPDNRKVIAQSGLCFWLDADAETILARIEGDATSGQRRPALTDLPALDEIRTLLEQRREAYADAADDRIETTGKETAAVAKEVLRCWRSRI